MKQLLILIMFINIHFLSYAQYTALIERDTSHYIIDNNVNVRNGPGKEYEIIGRLNAGDKVYVLESTDNWLTIENIESPWYKITSDTYSGYVCGRYISNKELILAINAYSNILACITLSNSKNTNMATSREALSCWDTDHVLIDADKRKITKVCLSKNPEKELDNNPVYQVIYPEKNFSSEKKAYFIAIREITVGYGPRTMMYCRLYSCDFKTIVFENELDHYSDAVEDYFR